MSIQSHSKPSKGLIIFSVYNKDKSDNDNNFLHQKAFEVFAEKGFYIKDVKGMYKGEVESSLVTEDTPETRRLVHMYASHSEQESILFLSDAKAHGIRKATLLFLENNKLKDIGWFRSRPKAFATIRQSYTYDYKTDKYFVVEPDYKTAVEVV